MVGKLVIMCVLFNAPNMAACVGGITVEDWGICMTLLFYYCWVVVMMMMVVFLMCQLKFLEVGGVRKINQRAAAGGG